MQFDDSQDSMFCPYCGGKVANIAQNVNINQQVNVSGTVIQVQDRSNDPNLYISYNTSNPSVGMVSRIVSTGVKGTYVNGQTLSYHLNQGQHTIILKIGKKNYSRNIVIPADNAPVRIYASFNGRAQISIDQPNVTVSPVNVSTGRSAPITQSVSVPQTNVPQTAGRPKSPLSIVAFVLSLTVYLSFIGAVLGAVETFVLDKEKQKNHVFSYIAMGLGVLLTFYLFSHGIGGASKKSDVITAPTVADTTIEETQATNDSIQSTDKATSTQAESTTKATTEATTTVDYTSGMDQSTAKAFNKGLRYLGSSSFSKDGLIGQLEFEGYSEEQATAAVDALEEFGLVNWNEQAALKAKSYLRSSSFSRDGLIGQLEFEGFTEDEAENGISYLEENNLVDWNEQAAQKAKSYLRSSSFSRESLISQLEFEGYTDEQAEYGVNYLEENNLVDWNEQAVKKAQSYLKFMSYSRDELIGQLEFEGFTSEQAEYAADQVGLT